MLQLLAAFDINAVSGSVSNATGATGITSIGDFFGSSGGRVGLNVLFFFVAGALLAIYLVKGGIDLMTSGGDPKKVAGAKSTITNALIGMIIVFSAYWIVQIVGIVLGLDGFSSTFGS